jgi:hypothetical protein
VVNSMQAVADAEKGPRSQVLTTAPCHKRPSSFSLISFELRRGFRPDVTPWQIALARCARSCAESALAVHGQQSIWVGPSQTDAA